jgi:type 1 glutamine amidotransferase
MNHEGRAAILNRFLWVLLVTLAGGSLTGCATAARPQPKKIVLVAGRVSHGTGEHEFRAGILLLKRCLDRVPGVEAIVVTNGWPTDPSVLQGAAAILIYADGGDAHPFIVPERLRILEGLMQRGVGLGAVHYGVEVPKDRGGPEFLRWIGGYFEMYHSVNPHWDANFARLPKHPITSGVQPFKIRDEWYYHMRFPADMKGVTPILTDVPPDGTRGRAGEMSTHGGNPDVQKHKGEAEHVMWCIERPDGGRGFGFTGGHFHRNWADDNFRKIILNGLLWIAKVPIPKDGVASVVTAEEMKANLDRKAKE